MMKDIEPFQKIYREMSKELNYLVDVIECGFPPDLIKELMELDE